MKERSSINNLFNISQRRRFHHLVACEYNGFLLMGVGVYPHGGEGRRVARAKAIQMNQQEFGKDHVFIGDGGYEMVYIKEGQKYFDPSAGITIHGTDDKTH